MKQLKVGDTLYYYNSTPIWGVVECSIYKIVGETPKFWKIERLGENYLCNKGTLVIRGTYRELQSERNELLDRELKLQELISEIDEKADFIRRNKRNFCKVGNIEAFKTVISALDNVIKEGEK